MAEFCKSCEIIGLPGRDDFKGATPSQAWLEGKAAVVLCEDCGYIQVDPEGNCVSEDCTGEHRKNNDRVVLLVKEGEGGVMAELTNKANIGTKEEPYWLTEDMWVHDMRNSQVRKVTRIIWDPHHQPEFYVLLELDAADLQGNGRELAELRPAEVELGCARCDEQLMALGDPNVFYMCNRCEAAIERGDDAVMGGDDEDCEHVECGLVCSFYDEPTPCAWCGTCFTVEVTPENHVCLMGEQARNLNKDS